jgi:cyanophycinase-like exopeptidase
MALKVDLAVPLETLILIGGGEFSFGETREIDERIVSRIPAENRSVAFLPTASGSAEYAVHFGTYLRQLDPSLQVTNVPIYRVRVARRQKNLNALLAAGLIYLGGGVTNNLLTAMHESAADLAMRDAARGGTVVAAIGAAASAFGAYARDMRGGTGALTGLGWLANTVIDTAFDPENDTTLRRLMSLPDVTLGLGIPSRTALVIGRDGTADIVGDGQIAAFRKR